MHKHAETLYTNRGDKLAIVIFIPTLPFSVISMNHFKIVFHMT